MAISFASFDSFVLFIVNFMNFVASRQKAKNTRQFPCTFGPSVLLAQNGEIRLLIGELSLWRLNLMPDYSREVRQCFNTDVNKSLQSPSQLYCIKLKLQFSTTV